MPHRLLVVEDAPALGRLCQRLVGARFKVDVARGVEEARRRLSAAPVHALLLDWTPPDGAGPSFIAELRESDRHRNLAIFVVTAQTARERCLEALRAGADECMGKPLDEELLVARLDSLTRRGALPWREARPFSCDGLTYEPRTRKVFLRRRELALRRKERELLEVFIESPNRVLGPDVLWSAVWGPQARNWAHTLEVTLCSLRRALGRWSRHIETHKGLGYMLAVPSRPPD